MPQAFGRIGEKLYLHGNITNRMLKTMKVHAHVPLRPCSPVDRTAYGDHRDFAGLSLVHMVHHEAIELPHVMFSYSAGTCRVAWMSV